jgi:mitogen-activated protein kinase 1/3
LIFGQLVVFFGELLNLMKEHQPDYRRRRALFPGESFGELSAEDLNMQNNNNNNPSTLEAHQQLLQESFHNRNSQLNVIFNVLGTPTIEEIEKISDPTIIELFTTTHSLLLKDSRLPPTIVPLETRYPAANPMGIILLKNLLQFDVQHRITAQDAFNHEYFNRLPRQPSDGTVANALLPRPLNNDIETILERPENLRKNVRFYYFLIIIMI